MLDITHEEFHDNDYIHEVSITYGHSDAFGNPLPPSVLTKGREYVEDLLRRYFGSASTVEQGGTCPALDGSVIKEASSCATAFTLEPPCIPCLLRDVSTAASILMQHKIMVTVQKVFGHLYFVGSDFNVSDYQEHQE